MARKSRATGVGRGNGPGSAKTQYKEGMPSANPDGRLKRPPPPPPPATLIEAFQRELMAPVSITEGGVRRMMPQYEVLVKMMFVRFQDAPLSTQIRLFQMIVGIAPHISEISGGGPDAAAVQEFLQRLDARRRSIAEDRH